MSLSFKSKENSFKFKKKKTENNTQKNIQLKIC